MTLSIPAHYRAKGVFLAFVGLLGLWMASVEGLINVYRIIIPERTLADGAYPYPPEFWQMNAILEMTSLGCLAVGLMAIFLAKEQDEFLQQMQLKAMQFAVVTQFVVGLVMFAYFYFTPRYQLSNTFQVIVTICLASFLLAYLLRFYGAVYFNSEEE